jgi:SPW repeat
MRFISTRAHGYIDYLMGIVLIISPWIFGFSNAGPGAVWTPVAIGVLLLGASLMTNYELGAVKLIPMPIHLATDMLAGVVLTISPWVLGFSDRVWIPHFVLGILELGVALMTHTHPVDTMALNTQPAGRR